MGCEGFGLLLSRYVDDDLGDEELDRLMGHLEGCPGCRMELRQMERLCVWFKAAGAFDAVPDTLEGLRLGHLLQREPPLAWTSRDGKDVVANLQTGPWRQEEERARGTKSPWGRMSELVHSVVFANRWRYAFPLVAMLALGVWFFSPSSVDRVDVRQLTPLKILAVQDLMKKSDPGYDVDLYVLQHASNQPRSHYGDELPMILQASSTIP